MPATDLKSIFVRLRDILVRHAPSLSVSADNSSLYCLEGRVGPATLRAWRGKMKRPSIPVAWVQLEKAYVSFHLMGIGGEAKARETMSTELQARMQGKTCLNFKVAEENLFQELEEVTSRACRAFQKAGFIE